MLWSELRRGGDRHGQHASQAKGDCRSTGHCGLATGWLDSPSSV